MSTTRRRPPRAATRRRSSWSWSRKAHLPPPQANVTRAGYELDCFWPHAKLNVEVDGAAAHHTRKAFHADRRRDRALRREGITVIRITWKDLTTGRAELADDIREIPGCR